MVGHVDDVAAFASRMGFGFALTEAPILKGSAAVCGVGGEREVGPGHCRGAVHVVADAAVNRAGLPLEETTAFEADMSASMAAVVKAGEVAVEAVGGPCSKDLASTAVSSLAVEALVAAATAAGRVDEAEVRNRESLSAWSCEAPILRNIGCMRRARPSQAELAPVAKIVEVIGCKRPKRRAIVRSWADQSEETDTVGDSEGRGCFFFARAFGDELDRAIGKTEGEESDFNEFDGVKSFEKEGHEAVVEALGHPSEGLPELLLADPDLALGMVGGATVDVPTQEREAKQLGGQHGNVAADGDEHDRSFDKTEGEESDFNEFDGEKFFEKEGHEAVFEAMRPPSDGLPELLLAGPVLALGLVGGATVDVSTHEREAKQSGGQHGNFAAWRGINIEESAGGLEAKLGGLHLGGKPSALGKPPGHSPEEPEDDVASEESDGELNRPKRLRGGSCSGKPMGEVPFEDVAVQAAAVGKGADSGLGFGGGSACDSTHESEAELVGGLGDEVSAAPALLLGHSSEVHEVVFKALGVAKFEESAVGRKKPKKPKRLGGGRSLYKPLGEESESKCCKTAVQLLTEQLAQAVRRVERHRAAVECQRLEVERLQAVPVVARKVVFGPTAWGRRR